MRTAWASRIAAIAVGTLVLAGCGPSATPQPTSAPTPRITAEPTSPPMRTPQGYVVTPSPQPDVTTYTVVKGDTLWGIARKFGVTLEALREANPQVADPTKMRVGTVLTIPEP